MPGMNSGLNVNDPTVVAAFKSVLLHQGLIALLIFVVLGLAWVSLRTWWPAGASGGLAAPRPVVAEVPGPAGRQLLMIGFGNLWLFDGFLQAQPHMAIGLPAQVIEPTAAASPPWVQHLVNWAGTSWSYHPLQAGAAAVWIQVGIGIWLLMAPRGVMSRLAGLVSAGWGLVVWVFGESFGGILAPGLSWLTGAPGAAGIYVVAGALIALPDSAWRSPRLGRLTLAGLGLFLAGMAVLQAWPGRGSWQGISAGQPGVLAGMAQAMSLTPQPGFLSASVFAFGTFDAAHGFAVNLFFVAALAVTGAAFLTGRPRLIRPVVIGFSVVSLAVWVLVQDLGFLGGLGTDPNSMIPFVLLAIGGYLALTRADVREVEHAVPSRAVPAPAVPAPAVPAPAVPAPAVPRRPRLRPAALRQRVMAASTRSLAALAGVGLIVLGAVPMAVAQASPNADPILAESIVGSPAPVDYPAPGFALSDQHGRTVTLASLRGKVVLLSFFDPACGAACPQIGSELRQAALMLGASARQVELVGVVLSPAYRSVSDLRAFDRRDGLSQIPGWLYLTGTPSQLEQVRLDYRSAASDHGAVAIGAAGAPEPPGGEVYVIDRAGQVRQNYSIDPGPGTAAIRSSFAVLFADAARHALGAG
jgi:cytochrome oxidase Cu insertion factor (SCO1/SenC/PrrC family)